jgi:hypothetical protein
MKKSENKNKLREGFPHFELDFNLKSSFNSCSRQVF